MLEMFLFTLNAEARLSEMQRQIRDFGHEDIPQGLETWQRDDMRRHYPNIETPDYVSAETTIWPRSRTYEKTHRGHSLPKHLMKRRSLSPLPRLIGATGKPGSYRPILRPELFDRLRVLMADLMSRKLTWRSTSRP
jgi:hypothetical protein